MKVKQLKRKIVLILLIISMLVPYIPVFTPVVKAASQLPAKTGYHINYHNNGNWTNYGQSIPGCDNAIADPNSRQCYHYLKFDVVTGDLYDDNGNILTKRVNTSDGGTWDISGEYLYGHYEGNNFKVSTYEVPGYTNFRAKKDVRIYYFVSSCPDCEANINGKYLKGTMYYRWQHNNAYGFKDVNFPGNSGGTAYPTQDEPGFYVYFAGYNNLAGEGLNSRGLYPTFDCAINNQRSRGITGYDANGNAIWNDSVADGFVWNAHTHTVYKYKCGGHYEPNTYTVTYNANGGTGSTGNTHHTYDQNRNLANNGFSRTGYTFGGWTDGTHTYSAGQTVKNLTATNGGVVTLYAIWNKSQFNLKVRPNGGSWNGSTEEQNFTMTYQDRKSISNPTRTGYRFTGWSLSGTGATLDGTAFTMGTGDATLTANWEKINYNLNVNPNGGTWEGSNNPQNFTMTYQDRKSINNPTRTGFTFTGWSLSGTGATLDGTAFIMGYANATLTANWTRNNYNLNVNPNGGTWEGSNNSQNFTIAYEENKIISNPIRYGYSFNGWTLQGDGSSLNGTTFRMGYNNATLTAKWNLITHNITGTVTWDDQNNKYSSRPENVTVTLSRNPKQGEVTPIPSPVQIKGNATYTFNNVQTYDTTNGNAYTYQVEQNKVSGYKTTINTYNITNQLIVPTYTSNISYSPIDTYKNLYLKNGKVKITANIQNTSGNTYSELGLNNGIVNFQIDPDISLDTATLKIYHTDNAGNKKQITKYTLNGNVLTVDFGENKISKSKDKIEIEVYGTLNTVKEYTSRISLTGKLRAYDGENTNIDLGTLTTKTSKITAQYQMPQANIKITKHDSITEQNLTDATFTLYEWNGNTFVEKEILRDTNNDGIYESKYYEWNKVTEGKYKIVETGVPANHKNLQFSMEFTVNQLAQGNYTITPDYSNKEYKITYGVRTPDDFDNINGIIENEPYKIKASIDLLDSENLRQIQNEATFKIYEWDKQAEQYKIYTSYTTGKEVKIIRQANKTYITEEWLYYTSNNEGKFRIVEEKAPTGYYGDYEDDKASKKRTYDISILDLVGMNGNKNETTITLSNKDGKFVNQRTKAIINLNKVDSETKGASQGDATLQGAIYEIYASENIYHADGITKNLEEETALLYRKDQLVAEKTTNEEGKISFDNLECGKYYIKEKAASNGYLLDEKTYEIDVTYQNETIKLITKEQTLEEKVKKQGFQIYKIKQTDRTEYEGLQNAGFTIYRINSLSIVKDGKITKNEDGTYTLNDQTAKNDLALKKLANRNGTYNIQDLIDYYYKIKYTEDNMGTLPQDQDSYHPYNIDEEKVKNYASSTQGSYIGELKSNGDGYIRSPELAYGEYIVIETTVPKNLETAKPFYINIQNDSRTVQKLKFITDENFETKVKIYKIDQTTGKTVLKAGAKYVIRNEAGELITFNTWDANKGYVEYGTLENPFVTGNDGYLVTPMNLKVGRYTLEEIEAPEGYVLAGHEGSSTNAQTLKNPQTKTTFEISTNAIYYTDDFLDTNVIVVKQQNQPQVGSLTLTTKGDYVVNTSKDEKGNYNFTYEERPIQGVTYEIRAKENILTIDGHNNIIYQKDQLVSTVTSNNDGIAYVDNLPQGKYYIVQKIAGNGFSLNEEQKEFEIKYGTNQKDLVEGTKEWKTKSQETPVVHIEENYKNQKQELKIIVEKIDGTTNDKIAGAEIGLYVSEDIVNKATNKIILAKDTLVQKGITNEEGKIIFENNLPLGEYYVKEIKAPKGYIYNGETKTIDGKYDSSQIVTKEVNVQIQNEKTNINIQKTTKEGSSLSGATLELRDSKDQIIEAWITTEEPKNIKALKTNEQYRIIETSPASGYVTAKEIIFSINDEGIIQTAAKTKEPNTIIMEDQTTKIIVELLDAKTKEQVSGATLKILNEKGEEVAKFETSNIAEEIQKLPIGKYTLVEEQAPQDKGYVTIDQVPFEIRDTEEIQRIVVTQEYTKLQVSLKDIETKEPVVRATLQLIKKTEENEQILDEWVTMVEPHQIEKLPVGKYYIRETVTPTDRGYVTISEQEIEIKDTLQIQNIELLNDVTKVKVNLIDKAEKTNIVGAILQIIKKDTNEVVREWETTEEPYNTQRLPVGSYIVKNKKANTELGQVTVSSEELTILDTASLQEITLEQDYTKLEVELLDRETKELLEGVQLEIYKVNIENGNKVRGEKVRDFVTGKENYNTTRLGVGEYLIHQVENQEKILQNEGFVTLQDTYFEIEDNPTVKKVSLQQDYTKIEVEVLDKETLAKVEGIQLQIHKIDTDENGNKTRGELVREFITGKENYSTIKLPVGEYIIHEPDGQKEVLQNQGYATIEDVYFTVENTPETKKVTIEQDFTKLEVELLDKETKEKVEGVKFEIYKVNEEAGKKQPGEKIREFETGKDSYLTTRIPVGEYLIHQLENQKEALQDKGYATIEDTYFKIEDVKETKKVTLEQDYTKVEVEVLDKETKEKVEGVKFEIYKVKVNENGEKQKGEKVREFIAEKENYSTIKLPVGEYLIHEVEGQKEDLQDKGYATIEDTYFVVEDRRDTKKVSIEQDYTKVEVEVLDKETKEKVQDAKFEIYKVEISENGTKQQGEKVREFITGKENYNTIKLPVGEYLIHEVESQIEAIQNKGYATINDQYFNVEDKKEVQKITLEQDYTKVEVELLEKETKEKIEGVQLEIYKVNVGENGEKSRGEKVREFTTGKENYSTIKLPVGEYLIHEVEGQIEALQHKGYATIEDKYFTVEDKLEVQKVSIEQDYTKVEVELLDKETKEKIEGVKFEIYEVIQDENGEKKPGEKVDEFTTGKDNKIIEKLPVGEYIIREVKDQEDTLLDKGYTTIEDIYFKVEDKLEIQKVEITQTQSILEIELVDKATKEKIEGSKLQIIKVDTKGKEEIVKEIQTKEENAIIEKLPVGEYILRQTEDVIKALGYVRIKDKKFKLVDTVKTQKMIVEQDYTKVQIKVVDIDTKELVLGSIITLQDKNGNEITEEWLSIKEPKLLTRIPVGEYYIVEKEAPTLRGYVKVEKVEIKVEETSDIQEFELEQDYTKLSLVLVDKETKEEIKEAELIIKDEKGNKVAEISLNEVENKNTEDDNNNISEGNTVEGDENQEPKDSTATTEQKIKQVLTRLPVGKYVVESTNMQYGYKQLKAQIEVKDTRGIQIKELEVERELFDIQVEEWIGQIVRNGKQEYLNQKEEQTVKKLDIKDKRIPTEDIKITYKIRVKNVGKITGQVGKIEVIIPYGMEFIKEANKGYWKEENGKIVTEGLAGRQLKERAYADIEITLRWKNGLENFGTKSNIVRILDVTSDIGFKESNEENNIAKASDVIIGVSTGEMNILWACWVLLILLILVEIYVSKKLHIKNFKIKDKTLKYRNKK